ncbi:hypothetical protein [Serratia fonticola]|uniref:hypothetical protein n=1 Tax=Serratia fonticola TaxID=47917 RepID=UPI00301D61A0
MVNLQKMVVVKGRTVRHDGKDYVQNVVINLPTQDADRLQELGFVVTLESVKQAIQDPEVDETHDDGRDTVGDDQNSGSADQAVPVTDTATATGSNKPDRVKKGTK